MADEPLYCPFCRAEDYGCSCPLLLTDEEVLADERELRFCEICGSDLPCERCSP